MKINWKLRLKNKATLITLATVVVAFIYQVLSVLDIVPKLSEDNVTSIIMMTINALAALGIVVDPTTSGISDSSQALDYSEPSSDDDI